MKKIIFYINMIGFGGAERVIVNLANEFSKKGYKVVFITSFKNDKEYKLNSEVKRFILDNNMYKSFFKKNIDRIRKIRKICKDENADMIISFMPEANIRSIIATRFLRIKTLISVRNDPDREYPNKLSKIIAKSLYRLADGCVFQTEDARRWFPNNIQKKSEIILNHVDEKFYKVNFNGERKDIVTVGRLESQKNHKLLIKAFAEVCNNYPSENLIIYGEGSLKKELINLTQELNIENRVVFKGVVTNIHEKIKNAKLFVMSSDYEGLPNALMEAMVLGISSISTDCPCGGPKMLIKSEVNGILVERDNINEMVIAIEKILSDVKFAEFISSNAKKRAQDFRPNIVINEWKKYIDEILET